MGVSLKTQKRRSRIAMLCFRQRVRRAEVFRGIAERGRSSKFPWSFAARLCYPRCFNAPSRILFVLQF
ncbi:MAG: hypothetical protein JW836_02460 [Deltaproteobacteria bacterium]|nr:hypothetical protein [Deltaproteobacteria bacterium]